MKLLTQWLSSAIAVVVAVSLCSPQPAFADGYTVYNLGNDNGRGLYGIDTAGDVVVWGTSGCGVSASYCYVTYVNGVATSDSSTAPVLDYDDGTACGSTPAGFNAAKSVCNDGWIGLGSLYNPNGDPNGIYLGSDSDPQFLQGGSVDQAFLNALGDFAWTDGQSEAIYVAIAAAPPLFESRSAFFQEDFDPVTTPEPASLLLVASGLFFFLAAIRRKANRQPTVFFN
jgi:hypothetical protein